MVFDYKLFASNWIISWNKREVHSVLAHYHDDVTFKSPTAMTVVGFPIIYGKAALQEYWMKALERHMTLHFTLNHVLWDDELSELAIVYTSVIDEVSRRVCEIMRFNADGHVVFSEVFHGVGD